jgi:hypothetical protein
MQSLAENKLRRVTKTQNTHKYMYQLTSNDSKLPRLSALGNHIIHAPRVLSCVVDGEKTSTARCHPLPGTILNLPCVMTYACCSLFVLRVTFFGPDNVDFTNEN